MRTDVAVSRIESLLSHNYTAKETMKYLDSECPYANDLTQISSIELKNTLRHSMRNHRDIRDKIVKLQQWYSPAPRHVTFGGGVEKFLRYSKNEDISLKVMIAGAVSIVAGVITAYAIPMLVGGLVLIAADESRKYFEREVKSFLLQHGLEDSVKDYKIALDAYKLSDRLFELNGAYNFKQTLDTGISDLSNIVSRLNHYISFDDKEHLSMKDVDRLSPLCDYNIELVKFREDVDEILTAVKTLKKHNTSVHIFSRKNKYSDKLTYSEHIGGPRKIIRRLRQYIYSATNNSTR